MGVKTPIYATAQEIHEENTMSKVTNLKMSSRHNVFAIYAMGEAFAAHLGNKTPADWEKINQLFHSRRRYLTREDMEKIQEHMHCGIWLDICTDGMLSVKFSKEAFLPADAYSVRFLCSNGHYTLTVDRGEREVAATLSITSNGGSGMRVHYPVLNENVVDALNASLDALAASQSLASENGDVELNEVFGGADVLAAFQELIARIKKSYVPSIIPPLTKLRKVDSHATA